MIFKYGKFAHADNEVELTIHKRPVYSARGFRRGTRELWHVDGILHAADRAELTSKIDALLAAYREDGRDAGLFLEDGSSTTSHLLDSSKALGGVKVLRGPDFPEGSGAEYSTFRTYSITLEATFPSLSLDLLSFRETIRFAGTGGPRYVFVETLNGLPRRQQAARFTTQQVVQSGTAVGYLTWPQPPSPIWPVAELQDRRRVARLAPRGNPGGKGGLSEFPVSWQYRFESAVPLSGNPNVA